MPHEVLATFKQRWQPHPGKDGLWLALEDIRDPGNLGTIIRTADAAGAEGIILAGDCCDPYAPECVRATHGSIFAHAFGENANGAVCEHLERMGGRKCGHVNECQAKLPPRI